MTLYEFIEEKFPIAEVIRSRAMTREDEVKERDNLPYDFIGYSDGELTKMLYLSADCEQDDSISVYELITNDKDDIAKLDPDDPMRVLYENYMTLVDVTEPEFMAALKLAEEWKAKVSNLTDKTISLKDSI